MSSTANVRGNVYAYEPDTDTFGNVFDWSDDELFVPVPTRRLTITGTSGQRMTIDGTSARRLVLRGTSGNRLTIEGTAQ